MQSSRVSVKTCWPYGLRAYGDLMGLGSACSWRFGRATVNHIPIRAAVLKSDLLGHSRSIFGIRINDLPMLGPCGSDVRS
jgi:hypothetical protein